MPPKPSGKPAGKPTAKPKPKPKGKTLAGLPVWGWVAVIGIGLLVGFLFLRKKSQPEQASDQAQGTTQPGYIPAATYAPAFGGQPQPNAPPTTGLSPDLVAELGLIESDIQALSAGLGSMSAGSQAGAAGSAVYTPPAAYTPPQPPTGAAWSGLDLSNINWTAATPGPWGTASTGNTPATKTKKKQKKK